METRLQVPFPSEVICLIYICCSKGKYKNTVCHNGFSFESGHLIISAV